MFCGVITCEVKPHSWLLSALWKTVIKLHILRMEKRLRCQSERLSVPWSILDESVHIRSAAQAHLCDSYLQSFSLMCLKSDWLNSSWVVDLVYSRSTRQIQAAPHRAGPPPTSISAAHTPNPNPPRPHSPCGSMLGGFTSLQRLSQRGQRRLSIRD